MKTFAYRLKAFGSIIVLANVMTLSISVAEDALTPQAFAQKAAISNVFEIEAAKLALARGKDPSAKTFAQDMVADHERAGIALERAAAQDEVTLPADLDTEHREKLKALESSADADFDQAYLSTQVSAHEEAVALFEKYTTESTDGALRSFAEKTLGTLRTHNVRIHGLTKE